MEVLHVRLFRNNAGHWVATIAEMPSIVAAGRDPVEARQRAITSAILSRGHAAFDRCIDRMKDNYYFADQHAPDAEPHAP
jgi:hypothetical protein